MAPVFHLPPKLQRLGQKSECEKLMKRISYLKDSEFLKKLIGKIQPRLLS